MDYFSMKLKVLATIVASIPLMVACSNAPKEEKVLNQNIPNKAQTDCLSKFPGSTLIASVDFAGITFVDTSTNGELYGECEWDISTGNITKVYKY